LYHVSKSSDLIQKKKLIRVYFVWKSLKYLHIDWRKKDTISLIIKVI